MHQSVPEQVAVVRDGLKRAGDDLIDFSTELCRDLPGAARGRRCGTRP
jgi:hypothetical protein